VCNFLVHVFGDHLDLGRKGGGICISFATKSTPYAAKAASGIPSHLADPSGSCACKAVGVIAACPLRAAMLQQPRVPPTGQRQAIEIQIKWREVLAQKQALLRILSKTTGHSMEKLDFVSGPPAGAQLVHGTFSIQCRGRAWRCLCAGQCGGQSSLASTRRSLPRLLSGSRILFDNTGASAALMMSMLGHDCLCSPDASL
jgi:Clp protease